MGVMEGRGRMEVSLDRGQSTPLSEQISGSLKSAILEGRLQPGARLPSWLDMATQLGVARGTVKAAYERLADEHLVISSAAGGTRVVCELPVTQAAPSLEIRRPLSSFLRGFNLPPLPFQMGVPSQDAFPYKLWSRMRTRAVREDSMAPVGPIDPRGNPELRSEIASYLAIARGIRCVPDQIILTNGFRSGLALAAKALDLRGTKVWMEDPGFFFTRMGLELEGMEIVPVPVDGEGIMVERGVELAPDAASVVVTASQQAPTGAMLSPERRAALLQWAADTGSWIIEDDYLSELQPLGRISPAIAGADAAGRVIHIGSFSKTMSPTIGMGFVVVPAELAAHFGDVAAFLQPAPNSTTQLALASFIREGHYLRHLRYMKRLYAERRDGLCQRLDAEIIRHVTGVSVVINLPEGVNDRELAAQALKMGIAPMPLSFWWHNAMDVKPGFVLGVSNLQPNVIDKACQVLKQLTSQAREIG